MRTRKSPSPSASPSGTRSLNYRINGGRTHDEDLKAWKGGETYGGDDNLHFDEYRAEIEDADPGDTVEVWFTGRTKAKPVHGQ